MKTSVILGLLLVLVVPTTVLGVSANDAGQGFLITEDGDIGAAPSGTPNSQIAVSVAGSYVLLAIVLVQGIALAFVLWKVLGRPQRLGSTFRRAFTCPVRGQEVIAEFQLDLAERPIDVVWCTAFRPPVVTECRKQCLSVQSVLPGASRERSGEFGVLHAREGT
jgi:hypothetical protein